MQNPNPGWHYYIPLDHIMVESNLSSAIHPHTIFQAWIWDSNQNNQPRHPEAKPPHPHQSKLGFTVIHPRSLRQHIEHVIIVFTMISTRSLGQTSMDATRFLHLHHEEFSYLLVSQPLLQSTPDHYALNWDPLSRIYRISQPKITRPNREQSTSFLYHIFSQSLVRIPRPTKATQNLALPHPTVWFKGY